MAEPRIVGKHAFRKDVPYIVHHPGEGSFVVGPDLIIKLDGIREVGKFTAWAPVGGRADSYLMVTRKSGRTTHKFTESKVRDWTYQLIVHLIEGTDPSSAVDAAIGAGVPEELAR